MQYTVSYKKNKYANNVHWIRAAKTCPIELWALSEVWKILSDDRGDCGSCVIGAGFLFKYKKKWYFMPPRSRWQGSCSWEPYVEMIKKVLENIGVTDLYYDWGQLD